MRIHGMSRTRTYRVWRNIKSRCLNPKVSQYKRYGGRGILLCERWLEFLNFLKDMGEAPIGMIIERIDNSKGYEPGNCKWSTYAENNSNKRNNVIVRYKGELKPICVLCKKLGLNARRVRQRIRTYKWTVEQALELPVRAIVNKRKDRQYE
jgi:hypothetical protein